MPNTRLHASVAVTTRPFEVQVRPPRVSRSR
jgi:hypothetical protein